MEPPHCRCFFPGCFEDPGEASVARARHPSGVDVPVFSCTAHLRALTVGAHDSVSVDEVSLPPARPQGRPSAIVEKPPPDRPVGDCSVAELLTVVIARAGERRGSTAQDESHWGARVPDYRPAIRRELSLAITYAEEALTRHNKAVYLERGFFAITDAERT